MSFTSDLRAALPPPHPAGRPFVLGGAAVAVAGLFLGEWLTFLGVAFALFCLFFFRDPTRVPPGAAGLWVECHCPATPPEADWHERFASRMLERLEEHAPGLTSSIVDATITAPLDLQAIDPNLVGGDSLSGSHHLDQFFCFRPAFGHSRWRTDVAGLYMVGASTWPGAGTGAGSGFMLAKELAA